jgi:hypothetical protein
MPPDASFGQRHFGTARLGDPRRTRSLVDLADRFARHPGGSLPDKCGDPKALQRCGPDHRFAHSPYAAVASSWVPRALRAGRGSSGIRSNNHSNTGSGLFPKNRSAAVVPSDRSTT